VLLFEPWKGQPFPGTLAQLKANPEPLKAWLDDKGWGVTADDVKKATVFLAAPVSGLAPRMKLLEEKLRPDAGPRLAVNPAELRDRFTAAAPAGPGVAASDVRFWNPPGDRFAYGRTLAAFLPPEEGGTDRDPAGGRLFDRYSIEQVPRSVFALPPDVRFKEEEPRVRLEGAARAIFVKAYFEPPTPLERIQRGQFQDALRALVEREDAFKKGLERLRSERDRTAVQQWCKALDDLFARLSNAKSFNPDDLPAAQAMLDEFWKTQSGVAQLIIDRVSADVGLAQASYLYALCMHEVAERKQVRAERATGATAGPAKAEAATAWREARNAWRVYHDRAGAQGRFPGRAEHARALADRAGKLAPPEK